VPKIALSEAGLRSIKPPSSGQTDFWDTSFKAGAFAIRVSQGGAKTFLVKHQNRRITIGRYPTISLAQARDQARTLFAEFTLGRIRPQSITYPQAIDLFLAEKRKSRRRRTADDYEWLLSQITFKGQLSELTHQELQRRLARITAEGTYNHVLVVLKVFFNWAIKRRYIEHNPTLGLSAHARETRSRVLTDAELQSIWRACEQTGDGHDASLTASETKAAAQMASPRLPVHFATIVRLLILTGMRRGECAALRAEYFSNEACTLPPTLTKNKREHAFPISGTTASLLSTSLQLARTSAFLFPARGSSTKPFNGWSKSKAALDKLSGVSGWTLHDLRRTFATRLAELGVAPHVIERLLNHVTGTMSPLARVYNRAKYMEEMRAAIELWESYLREKILCRAA
jgi:integrase